MALCPLLKETCIEHGCKFYIHLVGADPQTGGPIDKFDCTFAFLPMLLVEGARETRHTAAAVESLRNELTRQNEGLAQLLFHSGALGRPAIKDVGDGNVRTS